MFSYHKINKSLEMTRRITPTEEQKINAQLANLPNIRKNIMDLQVAINEPRWANNFAIHNDNMPLYAMLAFQNHHIEKQSFVTILLYWAIGQCHKYRPEEIHMHFLFDKEKGEASQYILKECVLYRPRDVAHRAFYLTDQLFENFMAELKKLPISEQRFFLVPFKEGSIVEILEGRFAGFRVLGTFNNQYMIASYGIMQAYLNVKFGFHAITINPVIGYSSILDIRENGLTDQRDFALHFPYVHLPEKADGHFAPWYIFSKHDFYHAAIISNIPLVHRYLFIKLSDAVKQDLQRLEMRLNLLEENLPFASISNILNEIKGYVKDEEESRLREFFSNYFIDMEGFTYVKQDYDTLEDKFWGFLQNAIYLYKFEYKTEGSLTLYQDVFFNLFDALFNEKDISPIFSAIELGFSNIRQTLQDLTVSKHLNLIKEFWDLYKEKKDIKLMPRNKEKQERFVSPPLIEFNAFRLYSPKINKSQDPAENSQYSSLPYR